MSISISHYAAEDFASRKIPFTIPANQTKANQSVEIVVIDDDMFEPVREGFRLLIVVDATRTPLSQVNFIRKKQLAMFRIDDWTDSESYYLTYITIIYWLQLYDVADSINIYTVNLNCVHA